MFRNSLPLIVLQQQFTAGRQLPGNRQPAPATSGGDCLTAGGHWLTTGNEYGPNPDYR